MFDWIRKVFGSHDQIKVITSTPSQQMSPNINVQKDTAAAPLPKKFASGEFVVTLQEDGLLPERVAEALSRLVGMELSEAQRMVTSVPVVLLDGVAEEPAHLMQRELQMLGAVVDVSRVSEIAESLVAETAAAPTIDPDTKPKQNESEIKFDAHGYQVYLSSLGLEPESVVDLLRTLQNEYETLAAVRWQTEMKIERVSPIVFGRSLADANHIAAELNVLGATAVVFHENDPNKPTYDHNQYGLVLVDAGTNPNQVVVLVADVLALDKGEAERLVAQLPLVLLENVAVETAIAEGERFSATGARCELPGPQKQVWFDPSTDHIQRQSGAYRVILHRVGFNKLLVRQTIENLRPDLSAERAEHLLGTVPQVLWTDINLATAELVKLKLNDFGATVVIQDTTTALKSGDIHPQNPDFVVGRYDVILSEFNRMQRIFLIKKLRDILPGSMLKELVDLLEMVPIVIVRGVNEETAVGIQENLAETGGVISIVLSET